MAFLGVPLMQEGGAVGLIALGNREGGYTLEQQQDIEALAPVVVEALTRRRAKESLEHATEELEAVEPGLAAVRLRGRPQPPGAAPCGQRLLEAAGEEVRAPTGRRPGSSSASRRAAPRMSEMIRDLLAYSRVNRKGKEPKPVDTEKCLAAALANLDAGIRESDARVTHNRLPTLTVDGVQLTQLFQNLIGNAIKFRKPQQPCLIHVGAEQDERQWVLSVRDNGIGIAPINTGECSRSSNASIATGSIRGRASGWRSASGSSSGTGGGSGSNRRPARGPPSAWRCRGTKPDARLGCGAKKSVPCAGRGRAYWVKERRGGHSLQRRDKKAHGLQPVGSMCDQSILSRRPIRARGCSSAAHVLEDLAATR